VQDFKADLNWEDIIPLEERLKAEEEERQKAVEEAKKANAGRRRAAQVKPGVYDGTNAEDAEISDAPPASTTTTTNKKPAAAKKTGAQRSLELNERDIRVLVRGIHRWGDIRYRPEPIISEGKLGNKNRSILYEVSDELIKLCEEGIEAHDQTFRDMAERNEPISSALRQKAVLVDCRGVSGINADTTLQRHYGLRLLAETLDSVEDKSSWRVPHLKGIKQPSGWDCDWGNEEDSKLLVAIYSQGFGQWDFLEKDESLGLVGKVFLESKDARAKTSTGAAAAAASGSTEGEAAEGKESKEAKESERRIPNAIHLVRRGDSLLRGLRDLAIEERGQSEDYHKKDRRKRSPGGSKNSPAPTKSKKSRSRPAPDYTDDDSDRSAYSSMDEDYCKELMRPCKKQLKTLKEGTDHLVREEKVAVLKTCLSAIGGHIDFLVNQDKFKDESKDGKKRWDRHLWCFSSYFWPKKVAPSKLKGIFEKLVGTTVPQEDNEASSSSKRKEEEAREERAGSAKRSKVEA
jgi:chromodomain-helicase-DNA-binding protein 1